MTKLITFGCSFTNYHWSTWADILGREFDEFENKGISGAGNTFIFNHIMQAIADKTITKDTTVIIMWSSIIREDRFINNDWLSPGNIYNQTAYNDAFMEYVDPIGFFVRDMAHISATYHTLHDIGCKFYFLNMMNYDSPIEHLKLNFLQKLLRTDNIKHLKKIYKKYIKFTKPSMHNIVYDLNWYNRNNDLVADRKLYQMTRDNLFNKWPHVNEWENNQIQILDTEVLDEICKFCYASDLDDIKRYKLWRRYDTHPTPLLHLEYLEKVLPKYKISTANIQKVKIENEKILKQPHKYIRMTR